MQLLNKDEPIPMRRCEMVTFPSGELEFNLKIFEDGVKVAHFLLESRPKEYKFGLNFQYDRNKLVHLYVTTTKGRITLQAKYEGLALADIENSVKIVSSFD